MRIGTQLARGISGRNRHRDYPNGRGQCLNMAFSFSRELIKRWGPRLGHAERQLFPGAAVRAYLKAKWPQATSLTGHTPVI